MRTITAIFHGEPREILVCDSKTRKDMQTKDERPTTQLRIKMIQTGMANPIFGPSQVPTLKQFQVLPLSTATLGTQAVQKGMHWGQVTRENKQAVLWRSRTWPCKACSKPSLQCLQTFNAPNYPKGWDLSSTLANLDLYCLKLQGQADFSRKAFEAFQTHNAKKQLSGDYKESWARHEKDYEKICQVYDLPDDDRVYFLRFALKSNAQDYNETLMQGVAFRGVR